MKTCLVVDDSKVVRKVARHILESLDFVVEEASDGQQALDRCGRSAIDVVLLDWNMPVLNGIEFLRALGSPRVGRPKVIFCTSESTVDHVRAAIVAGADEYVVKPFDRQTLQAKMVLVGMSH